MNTASSLRLALAASLRLPAAASASNVGINPILIQLTREAPSEQVVLTNPGTEAARFELNVFAWQTDSKGAMVLTPTDDVLFFPRLFQLGPGETRQIRLGTTKGFGEQEKSYRLIVQELPQARHDDGKGPPGLQVLSRLSLPIFLGPRREVVATHIEPAAPEPESVGFRLLNNGTVHVRPSAVRARTVDENGLTVAEKTWDGWYLLAGAQREYRFELGREGCKRARRIEVSVTSSAGALEDHIVLPRAGCGY